jgi:UDP-N-acetylmuramoyl-tripeptide--D-alanyl-D-alanine ligase
VTDTEVAATVVPLAASGLAGVRWLRVAQREHYLAGSVSRFALRWLLVPRANLALAVAAGAAAGAAFEWSSASYATAAAVAVGPIGLGLRGRTARLAWTRRMRTLAAVWATAEVVAVAVGWAAGAAAGTSALACLAVPLLVDLALAVTSPLEAMVSQRYVDAARRRLDQVSPTVVAITGSFGKTSTKVYTAHLLAGAYSVVASPASFNNRSGLARTVNEHLAPGTEVLVAEMGTYGPGEIADMCSWMAPDVAVITAIGPVHLERFGSERRIAEAKSEITQRAHTVVLNVDAPFLGELADELSRAGKEVLRCSSCDAGADFSASSGATGLVVRRDSKEIATCSTAAVASNVCCAVAVASALGVGDSDIARRLEGLPPVPSRLSTYRSEAGFVVVDDTYNSNPSGARLALEALRRHSSEGGRRVVVTPGMVELGRRQREENAAFGAAAASVATDVVVVGRTNREALLAGLGCAGAPNVVTVASREQAVAWVRSQLGDGDVVLYENDLPDHFA